MHQHDGVVHRFAWLHHIGVTGLCHLDIADALTQARHDVIDADPHRNGANQLFIGVVHRLEDRHVEHAAAVDHAIKRFAFLQGLRFLAVVGQRHANL